MPFPMSKPEQNNIITSQLQVEENELTPSKRARRKGSIATRVKNALFVIAPACLITLTECPPELLKIAHVLDRKTKDTVLAELEKAWRPRSRSGREGKIKLDSRFNLLHLNVTMHRLFEKFYWTLVPDLDDLDAVHALYRFGWDEPYSRFPRLDPYARLANKEPFSYHFVPLPTLTECKNANIVRYTTGPEVFSEEVPSEEFAQFYAPIDAPGCATIYPSPFARFPVLRSHVHPFYVICKAYYAFRFHFTHKKPPSYLMKHWELLQNIYKLWVKTETLPALEPDNQDHLDDKSEPPSDASSDILEPTHDTFRGAGERDSSATVENNATHKQAGSAIIEPLDDLLELGQYCSEDDEPEMEIVWSVPIPKWAKTTETTYDVHPDDLEEMWKRDVPMQMRRMVFQEILERPELLHL